MKKAILILVVVMLFGCSQLAIYNNYPIVGYFIQPTQLEFMENGEMNFDVFMNLYPGDDERFMLYTEVWGDDELLKSSLETYSGTSKYRWYQWQDNFMATGLVEGVHQLEYRLYWVAYGSERNCDEWFYVINPRTGEQDKIQYVCQYHRYFMERVDESCRYEMFRNFNPTKSYVDEGCMDGSFKTQTEKVTFCIGSCETTEIQLFNVTVLGKCNTDYTCPTGSVCVTNEDGVDYCYKEDTITEVVEVEKEVIVKDWMTTGIFAGVMMVAILLVILGVVVMKKKR